MSSSSSNHIPFFRRVQNAFTKPSAEDQLVILRQQTLEERRQYQQSFEEQQAQIRNLRNEHDTTIRHHSDEIYHLQGRIKELEIEITQLYQEKKTERAPSPQMTLALEAQLAESAQQISLLTQENQRLAAELESKPSPTAMHSILSKILELQTNIGKTGELLTEKLDDTQVRIDSIHSFQDQQKQDISHKEEQANQDYKLLFLNFLTQLENAIQDCENDLIQQ